MRRRGFIAGLGAAAWAPPWPPTATAQQASRAVRVGFVHYVAEQDPDGLDLARLFKQGMEKLGWTLGRNLMIDFRWGVSELEKARLAAVEILKLAPDVIVCGCRRQRNSSYEDNGGPPLSLRTVRPTRRYYANDAVDGSPNGM
jgi:hypothetical protein